MWTKKPSENETNKKKKQKEAALIKWWRGIITLEDRRISFIVNS